jgi:hypothetical protein
VAEAEELTPELVEQRLNALGRLYQLGMSLRTARFLDPSAQADKEATERLHERLRDAGSVREPSPRLTDEPPPTT